MGLAAPRAGTPIVNLRRTLRDLTDVGFSVVVCEEVRRIRQSFHPTSLTIVVRLIAAQVASPRGHRGRKQRFIGGIVSPAAPAYLYDLVLSEDSHPEDAGGGRGTVIPPIVGVRASTRPSTTHSTQIV